MSLHFFTFAAAPGSVYLLDPARDDVRSALLPPAAWGSVQRRRVRGCQLERAQLQYQRYLPLSSSTDNSHRKSRHIENHFYFQFLLNVKIYLAANRGQFEPHALSGRAGSVRRSVLPSVRRSPPGDPLSVSLQGVLPGVGFFPDEIQADQG